MIGAKGAQIKKIGTMARKALETLLGKKVFLETFVKVREGWRDDAEFLSNLD